VPSKGTLKTCEGVLRSWKVSLGLCGGPGEEYSLVGEDLDCDRVEVELRRREQKGGKWR